MLSSGRTSRHHHWTGNRSTWLTHQIKPGARLGTSQRPMEPWQVSNISTWHKMVRYLCVSCLTPSTLWVTRRVAGEKEFSLSFSSTTYIIIASPPSFPSTFPPVSLFTPFSLSRSGSGRHVFPNGKNSDLFIGCCLTYFLIVEIVCGFEAWNQSDNPLRWDARVNSLMRLHSIFSCLNWDFFVFSFSILSCHRSWYGYCCTSIMSSSHLAWWRGLLI